MCTYYSKEHTEELFKNEDCITCYKVVEPIHPEGIVSMYYPHIWHEGFNEAIHIGCYEEDNDGIRYAIHVYVDQESAKTHSNAFLVIMPVKCYKEDLIGCDCNKTAAFKRVFVEKEDYQKALGN